MGSWNETCALTRQPIVQGDPVVKFHTVSLPPLCYESQHEMGSVPLMLGLFSRGVYTDCGHIALGKDALTVHNERWCAHALATNEFWRMVCIIDSPDVLVPLEGGQLQYELMMGHDALQQEDEDFAAYASWLEKACITFAQTNAQWVATLADAQTRASVLNAMNENGKNAFHARWPTIKTWLCAKGLLAPHMSHLLVHGNAFDAMVSSSLTEDNTVQWRTDFEEWASIAAQLGNNVPTWMRCGVPSLAPLSRPLRAHAVPISAHYWHTVQPSEALEHIPLEALFEYNAFKTSLQSTRANLLPGTPGSQGRNRDLLMTAVTATML